MDATEGCARPSAFLPNPMQGRGKPQPVSRELVRIIRESSRLRQQEGVGIAEHMAAITARQTKEIEFYLRACALRLAQGS